MYVYIYTHNTINKSDKPFSYYHFLHIVSKPSVGHKNLNKVLVPRVVSMAEESIIMLRRPHAWIVRPRDGTLPEEVIL